jgi:hypothetical protein
MAARVLRSLKIIALNANGIWRRYYDLSEQLQDLHTDVALLSDTNLKPHDRFFIPNYHFYRTECFSERKGGTAAAVTKRIPHNHAGLWYVHYTKAKHINKTQNHPLIREYVT